MNRRNFLFAGAATSAALLLHSSKLMFGEKVRPVAGSGAARIGAEIPWTTYPVAEMKTNGRLLGPSYEPFTVAMESSGQRCVKLSTAGQYVEFTAQSPANAIVVRYCLPDSPDGGGLDSTLDLYRNGQRVHTLALTSKYTWRYGSYPFTNNPHDGKPRNFYDEVRLKNVEFAKGDVIRLQKPQKPDDADAYCILDLVDLERVAPPLHRPPDSLSVLDFGASGTGRTDDTESLRRCLAAAATQRKIAFVPPGEYLLTGDIDVPSNVLLQGAGMWHTTFVGDEALYPQANRRLRFKLTGKNIRLADFALIGKLKYRNDQEQNDGIFGAHATNCNISRLWIEHTKVGMWFYICESITVESCRLRNTLADGLNFCVDVRNSVVENSTARNTGDDCFAIWPAVSDQSFQQQTPLPGGNVFRQCTGELPFLANGGAIYGGASNRIEDCRFTDIASGCGILLSTTFQTSDGITDNNFSGATIVRNCELIRCGGFDHDWAWRAALQICMDRRSISGLRISDVHITDSLSDGFSVVAPGSRHGEGTLRDSRLENVMISKSGIGVRCRHDLWIREDVVGGLAILNSRIADIVNSSPSFKISSR